MGCHLLQDFGNADFPLPKHAVSTVIVAIFLEVLDVEPRDPPLQFFDTFKRIQSAAEPMSRIAARSQPRSRILQLL